MHYLARTDFNKYQLLGLYKIRDTDLVTKVAAFDVCMWLGFRKSEKVHGTSARLTTNLNTKYCSRK